MKFIARREWGGGPHRVDKGGITPSQGGVTVHWEATRGLQAQLMANHQHCALTVRAILDYHTRPVSRGGNGWQDIAYTALACPHGYVFEGRWVGRRTAANGTDAGNDSWYAVCALNGVGDAPCADLLAGIDDAVRALWFTGARRRVNGHRDHKATACPGDALYEWVRAGMPLEDDMGTPAENAQATYDKFTDRQTRVERALDEALDATNAARSALLARLSQPLPVEPELSDGQLARLADMVAERLAVTLDVQQRPA